MAKQTRVLPAKREIIQDRLLASLDDKSKVAIVVNKDDLDLLIEGMVYVYTNSLKRGYKRKKSKEFLDDMRKLRKHAFGEDYGD